MIVALGLLKARILGAVTGVAAQAIAVGLVVLCLAIGLFWLRYDARMDERRAWENKMAQARAAHLIILQRRETTASYMAMQNASEWAQEKAILEQVNRDLQDQLAPRVRVTCYPKDIIKAMNK